MSRVVCGKPHSHFCRNTVFTCRLLYCDIWVTGLIIFMFIFMTLAGAIRCISVHVTYTRACLNETEYTVTVYVCNITLSFNLYVFFFPVYVK